MDFSAPSLWNWIILRWKFTSVNREHKRVGAVRCVLYVLPCRFRFDSGVGQDQKEEAKFISSSPCLQVWISQPLLYGIG